MMINNKQVNLWRGDSTPPTLYHIWIKDNSKLLLYDGKQWVVFLDNRDIIDTINSIMDKLEELENKTVNSKPIKDNPVLDGNDLLLEKDGTFIKATQTISDSLINIDTLLTTQII